MEKIFDSLEKLELIFKDYYDICNPVAEYKLATEHRLNPAVPTTISFLCKTVKSFDNNLDKENFKLVWNKFYDYICQKSLLNNVTKFDNIMVKKIREIELRLNDNFDQYKKGQGLENFLEEKYEIFLKEARYQKSVWIKKTKNPEKHEIHFLYDIGDFNYEFQN